MSRKTMLWIVAVLFIVNAVVEMNRGDLASALTHVGIAAICHALNWTED